MNPVLDPPELGNPDIRLIAVDMDGSLLDDDKRVDPSFWPLLDQLHERGIALCPASGRQYATLRDQFGRDDLVYIAENGAYVVHEGREVGCTPLGAAAAREALDAVRAAGDDTGVVLCGKRSAYVERTDDAFLDQVRPYYHLLQTVPDLAAVEDDVLKVAVYDFDSSARTARALDGLDGVMVSGPHWVDVMDPAADKGVALRQVQHARGIGPAQTMAFGDFHNDLGMLAAAQYSFAMDNAHPDVRSAARYVAPANSRNGVVRTITAALGL
ncbi:Cof-type HAD-IIB family hydrolase [Cellulomonas edaphi]|uniref:Cof-type HAD-IIB family hydrolase n=1 Tax=Cellulomonas edaphi TaxID=3053468 RepID=A0ABT7S2B6_9CELL|nr:Cof-type HAD-IIB family hydrolase [Cellulomons edaphi]MDM7829757.1 Cof-type HAD-IIB family hydrolase [Cellulomons edaphi]